MSADIEQALQEDSKIYESHGGVFEVEYKGQLIYSKKANGRFPEDDEVLLIVKGLEEGLPLAEAQSQAAQTVNAQANPSFLAWLQKRFLARQKA